jgi:hypothetical protein
VCPAQNSISPPSWASHGVVGCPTWWYLARAVLMNSVIIFGVSTIGVAKRCQHDRGRKTVSARSVSQNVDVHLSQTGVVLVVVRS